MYFIGGDHYNNRIPHEDLQIFCHRVYPKIPWDLTDTQLKKRINEDVFISAGDDKLYTRTDTSLHNFLSDCKQYNIVPVVNNNFTYLDPTIPITEYARRAGIIDQLMYEAGFRYGFQSYMNEPGKRHSTVKYVNYVNAADREVNHFSTIAGNDEYNMIDWNYLLDNGNFDILGVHPLSSLGYPPNWNILNDWATMATARGKPYMITEGGSWFKSYFSLEGYTVIKNMILRAKALGYLATLIVLLDVNEGLYPKLGFRRFTKDYKTLTSTSDYWDDFINLVNREGKKYEEVFEMYGIEINYVKLGCHNEECRAVQQIMLDLGYDLSPYGADSWYGPVTEEAIRKWQTDNGLQVDGIVGKETWQWVFENIDKGMLRFMQMLARTGRYG